MKRRIWAVLTAAFLAFTLCGCDLFTADTDGLLSPPELSGDLKPISEAIKKSAGKGYTFKYPSRGNYRSAVVREDIDGDGILEAFAFYSTSDNETVTMNIDAVCKTENGWESVARQQIVAGGVDKVDFCDLDGDGKKEVLVGWEIYGTSEMQLAVYSLGGITLTQRMLQKYTHFLTCDLDGNGAQEVFLIKPSGEQINTASVFVLNDEGVSEASSCKLDSSAKTVNEPVLSALADGRSAVYIDEVKGAGAVTEVLLFDGETLMNPLCSSETGETTATLRAVTFATADIDGDGVLEIPVQANVPSVSKTEVNEKLYLINWSDFDGSSLTVKMTAMMNVNDGYYFKIPAEWYGKIALLKDTDSRLREIYRYNPDDMTVGDSLMYIKAVKKSDWEDGKYKATGVEEILSTEDTAFICKISASAKDEGITAETVRESFKLTE